jgi:hypothetical protein
MNFEYSMSRTLGMTSSSKDRDLIRKGRFMSCQILVRNARRVLREVCDGCCRARNGANA